MRLSIILIFAFLIGFTTQLKSQNAVVDITNNLCTNNQQTYSVTFINGGGNPVSIPTTTLPSGLTQVQHSAATPYTNIRVTICNNSCFAPSYTTVPPSSTISGHCTANDCLG